MPGGRPSGDCAGPPGRATGAALRAGGRVTICCGPGCPEGTGAPPAEREGADRYPEHSRGDSDVPQPRRPEAEPEAPNLDFAGTTPYEDYVQADVLTHLQHPLSDDPGEMVFLVTTQVMELWFTVIVHEWETAAAGAARGRPARRAGRAEALPYELRVAERLLEAARRISRPRQFNAYRSALGEGSGFQSAMYRRMEFLLGEKSASMLVPHRGAPRVHAELEKALHEPSLYDEVLRLLARRGYAVPAAVLDRDLSQRYEPHARGRGGLGRASTPATTRTPSWSGSARR